MTGQPWSDLTSFDRVVALHEIGIRQYEAGSVDPPSRGCVEGAVGNAWTAKQYAEEDRQFSLVFVAYVLFYLAKDHCFTDGNKRVAWMTAVDILAKYGLTIDAEDNEAVQFVTDVVDGSISSGEKVAVWLAERLVASACA